MKKGIFISICFIICLYNLEAQNKEKRSRTDSFLKLSPEEAEMETIRFRESDKKDEDEEEYSEERRDAMRMNHASLIWNEYFTYAANKGASVMSTHGSWTNISCSTIVHTNGQSGAMGRMNCVRTDPNNANIVYAGSPSGGLWKSVDGGDSWTCLTDGLPRIGISDIAINPNNPNEIYILTGDGDYRLCPSIGVLKSYNGGFTWSKTGLAFSDDSSLYARKLIINPSNPDVLFAVTSLGVYKTSSAGNQWSVVLSDPNIFEINFKPAFPDTVYACNHNSLYKSTNGGNSFGSPLLIHPLSQRLSMATTIVAPGFIYLLSGVVNNKARLYLSTNSGNSFVLKSDTTNGIVGQVTLDIALEASQTSSSVIYAGVLGMYKSTNQGSVFNTISSGGWGGTNYVHVDIHDIETRSGVLYVASDGGIYKSSDGGITWSEKNNGLSVAWITSISHLPVFPDLFYFGSFDNGLNKRTSGSSCKHLIGGDGFNCMMDYTDPLISYGLINGDLLKTDDGGDFYYSLGVPSNGDWVRCMVMHPSDHNIIYAACNEVYKSVNGGDTWVPTFAYSSGGRSCIAICNSNPNYIYSATRAVPNPPSTSANLIQRYDGVSWTPVKGNLPVTWTYEFSVTGMAVDPADVNHVWVTFCGYQNGQKVYETIDGGLSWFNRSGTLPNIGVNCIAMAPGANNEVYIGTDVGVFYRSNTFSDWIPFINGLPRTHVSDLVIDPVSNSLYAATIGRGLWQSDLFSSCPSSHFFTGSPYNTQYGYRFYEAANTIESDRYIDGSYGNNIIYKAGNYVNFVPGFEAIAGSEVTAKTGSCSGFPLVIPLSGNYDGEENSKSVNTVINENQFKVNNPAVRLTVYPEPHTDFINVEFASTDVEPVTIVITDMLGNPVESILKNESFSTGKHIFQISTRHHKSGIYAVTFSQGKNVFTKKIVKL
ncbi:MAG TPA: T9SS type A sorting domain-containing protein [Bacteroidia bacterium]|nr:T9SS type A sorting domain-containing protein [Bacteroidia bacterium]